jgi:hypothetical protein
MNSNLPNISEMQSLIGVSEESTDQVLNAVKSTARTLKLLPVYDLLLLERFDNAIQLIQETMEISLDLEYLHNLQRSRFYLQRKAVPIIIKNLTFDEKIQILKTSLKDEICDVVIEAVASIKYSNPFNNDELLNIAIDLFKNKYSSIKVLSADLLAIINSSTFLLADLIKSNNWRLRLRVASCFLKFNLNDQLMILLELKKDPIDEIRIELSKSLKGLEHIDLLEDSCEFVRSNYLSNVIDQIEDQYDFNKILEDKSWEVKKILLNLKGDLFKRITIPLIKSSTENVPWRIKHEVLSLVENNIDNEFAAKLLLGFLIKSLKDKICEIRTKSQQILCKIIKKYDWVNEIFDEIENLAVSSNYLHRVAVVPVVIEFDIKFNLKIGKNLFNDKIKNVRDRALDYISENNLDIKYF